jgi:hypothetical protein
VLSLNLLGKKEKIMMMMMMMMMIIIIIIIIIMSRNVVTIDKVWIGNQIYWTL